MLVHSGCLLSIQPEILVEKISSEATLGDPSGVISLTLWGAAADAVGNLGIAYDQAEEGFPKLHIKHVELVLVPGAVKARQNGKMQSNVAVFVLLRCGFAVASW